MSVYKEISVEVETCDYPGRHGGLYTEGDAALVTLDELSLKADKGIALLNELRSTLISAAVAGQTDVRSLDTHAQEIRSIARERKLAT